MFQGLDTTTNAMERYQKISEKFLICVTFLSGGPGMLLPYLWYMVIVLWKPLCLRQVWVCGRIILDQKVFSVHFSYNAICTSLERGISSHGFLDFRIVWGLSVQILKGGQLGPWEQLSFFSREWLGLTKHVRAQPCPKMCFCYFQSSAPPISIKKRFQAFLLLWSRINFHRFPPSRP